MRCHCAITGLAEDVLLREVPWALGLQNASHLHMLSLSDTRNLRALVIMPNHFDVSWIPPSLDRLELIS